MIFLTGGTGFLGSHIARRLIGDGRKIVFLKRSSSSTARIDGIISSENTFDLDQSPLEALFAHARPDIVLHCATNYGRGATEPSSVVDANLTFPLRLLEVAITARTPVFINTDTVLNENISPYAASKRRFAEALASRSADLVGINVALEHFFGPGGGTANFVSRMVSDLVSGVERIPLTLGRQKRDFIFVDDVVDAFVTLIQHGAGWPKGFYPYQVGSGRNVSIRELMALLVRLTGNTKTQLDFGAIAYRPNETMETHVDISGLKKLGWAPKTTLEDGLRRMLEAARERPERLNE